MEEHETRGFLLALLEVVKGKGWERALKRAMRDEFGLQLGKQLKGAECSTTMTKEDAMKDVVRQACERCGLASNFSIVSERETQRFISLTQWASDRQRAVGLEQCGQCFRATSECGYRFAIKQLRL